MLSSCVEETSADINCHLAGVLCHTIPHLRQRASIRSTGFVR
jgi:hypothetical protein